MSSSATSYNSFTVKCGAAFQPSYIPGVLLTFMLTRNNALITDVPSTSSVMAPSPTIVFQNILLNQTAFTGPDTLVYNCTVVFSINGSLIAIDSSTTQIIVRGMYCNELIYDSH